MTQQLRATQIASLAGMIIVLLLAFGLDRALLFVMEENSITFLPSYPVLWAYPVANLVLAISLLVLFWLVAVKSERSKLVAAIFLGVGALMLFAPLIYFTAAFANLKVIDYLMPEKLLYHTGAFIAAIGLLALILPKHGTANF